MARYRMNDDMVVDTENATKSWPQKTDFDGHNQIGRSTGSEWKDQTLHLSRRGRYYTETCSRCEGVLPHVEGVSDKEAARFLLLNEYELPLELQEAAESVSE